MKNTIENAEEILSRNISGFHQYVLSEPVHVSYVSENFCAMTGFSPDELLSESEDRYAALVCPADRDGYLKTLGRLKEKERTLTVRYRLVKKDGSLLSVSDTLTSKKTEDGAVAGYSVLTVVAVAEASAPTDVVSAGSVAITGVSADAGVSGARSETDDLHRMQEKISCGFLKFTCEKQPKVTYINRQMMEFLRFPETEEEERYYLELYQENIFLMVPMEERRRFALYLNRVHSEGAPIAGELTAIRCDGTRAYFWGWVAKCVNEQGVEEFQGVCMDITERHHAKKANEAGRYLKALTDIYDKIFAYDFSDGTVKCLYSQNSPMFQWLEEIPMQMEEATEKWIMGTVAEEDCSKVRAFFKDFFQKKTGESDAKPPQVEYRALSSDGGIKRYRGILLKTEDSVCLYCCRCIPDQEEADSLRNENVSLKENMQELIVRFTDGLAAFEINDRFVTPLYASDNVAGFFGFSSAEWLSLMKKSTPIEEFVARCEVGYEDFAKLLRVGESEYRYFDVKLERERRIKAVCSPKASGKASPRYVMLYNVGDPKEAGSKPPANRTVSIRTFGYFDVFVDEKPIAFRNKKSKELFALLVDRRGGYVSSEEAIGFLWEDEPVSPVTLARYRKVALRLKNILEEYGISEVVEAVDGKRRIVPERVQCDIYDYLSGRGEYAQLFKGSYLTNYSWGENTLAELTGTILY